MPLSVTNAEKLSLSPSTPVGQVVSVVDSFSLSGAGDADGFFTPSLIEPGKYYRTPDTQDIGSGPTSFFKSDGAWYLYSAVADNTFPATSSADETYPWEADWTDAGITLTHPAIQRLVAPDSSQGGVAVLNGTQDGVYVDSGTTSGKRFFNLLGTGTNDADVFEIHYYPDMSSYVPSQANVPGWVIQDGDGATSYYSLSAVATPDLASNWKRADIGEGAFVDGLNYAYLNGVYDPNGTLNGKTLYSFRGSATTGEFHWTGTQWELFSADDADAVYYYSTDDVASPWLVTTWTRGGDSAVGPASLSVISGDATITVSSVSVGEIYAGLYDTNDGPANGSSYVSQPFHGRQYYMGLNGGGSNNMHWDTDFNVWTDDVGVWTSSNVIFPWQGTDNGGGHTGATFARNDVANEANWLVTADVPSTDADLASLTPSFGDLDPAFDPATTSYVLNARDGTTLIAVTSDNTATVDSPITLQRGPNAITVTAGDGITTKTYNVLMRVPGRVMYGGWGGEPLPFSEPVSEEEEELIMLALSQL